MHIEIEGDIVKGIQIIGGCEGNRQAVMRLSVGMKIEDVISKLEGIDCKGKGTSCPDQLTKALVEALKNCDELR